MRQVLGEVSNLPLYKNSSAKMPTALKPCKTGTVYMCQPRPGGGSPLKVRVVLSVYQNSFDRYAVVSSDKILCKDCGYINLKTCSVKKVDKCTLQLTHKDGDTGSLVFCFPSNDDCSQWVSAIDCGNNSSPFQASRLANKRPMSPLPGSLRSRETLMPALAEDEESAESEE